MQEAATSTKIRGGAEGEPRDDRSAWVNGQPARWLSQGIASSTGPVRVSAPVAPPGHRSPARAATERDDCWMKRGAVRAGAVLAGSAILFGIPRPIHLDAPGARAAIETLIATSALVGAGLLVASLRQGRRRGDLLLLTALATAGLTDFVFSALPALTGARTWSESRGRPSSMPCATVAPTTSGCCWTATTIRFISGSAMTATACPRPS